MLLVITLGVLSSWFVVAIAAGLGIARAIALGQRLPQGVVHGKAEEEARSESAAIARRRQRRQVPRIAATG